RRGPLRLEEGPQPPPRKRHPIQTTIRTIVRQIGNFTGHEDSTVRRLQQLVRGLRFLGSAVLRRQKRRTDERRTEKMDRRRQPTDQRHSNLSKHQLQGIRTRRDRYSLLQTSPRPLPEAQ